MPAPFAGQAVVVALVVLGAIGLGLVALAVDSVAQRSVLVARPQQGQGRIRAQALAGTESPNKVMRVRETRGSALGHAAVGVCVHAWRLAQCCAALGALSNMCLLSQGFGVYAYSVKNTVPTSRGFDFYTYANADPYAQPGDEPDADKFNARALRSMQALMKRAKRLQKIVKALSKDVGTKELDVNLSPRGPIGPVGGPGPVGYVSCVLCGLYDSRSTGSSPPNFRQLALDTMYLTPRAT